MPLIGCGIGGLSEAELRRYLLPYAHAPVDLKCSSSRIRT
jgi:hypothetical protein